MFLAMFGTETFGNVWYWIVTIAAWSAACHWTLGVPHDAVVRADHRGGLPAEQVEAIGQAAIARTTWMFRRAGVWIAGAGGFLIAVLATLGFGFGVEIARGAVLLLGPLAIVAAANVRLAFRLERAGASGAALRRALSRRRFWNQVIGLAAVTVAAGFGAWHILGEAVALR
jgi:hypothetical protein